MPMIDLGRKPEKMTVSPPSGGKQPEVSYPSFYIDKEIPMDEKSIGKEIMVVCKLKLRSISKRSDKKGNDYSCSFDVMGIDLLPKKKNHYAKD